MKTCMRITVLALALMLCLTSCSALHLGQRRGGAAAGQPGGGGPGPGRGVLPSPEFDQTPFDITRERLPPVYIGHNVQLVYNGVRSSLARRSDGQETAAETLEDQGGRTIRLSWPPSASAASTPSR